MNIDPNRDGKLDINDVTYIMDVLSSGKDDPNCDLNGDGKVNIEDVTFLQDALSAKNGIVITLDPGHGEGYNTVKYKDFTYSEGTRMFTYALILERELVRRGYTVYVTRATVKSDPTHAERAEFAAKHNSDVLISLHSNAKDSDPNKKGVVVVYSMADKPFNKPFGKAVAEAVASVMGNGVVDVFWSESKSYPGEDYFGILRYAARDGVKRAIIVEHGYHSNEGEARWLSSDENLYKMAKAEAKAIDTYLRSNLPKKTVMYRTQVGSYLVRANAEKAVAKLKKDGFGGFAEKIGLSYKVYAGSYKYKKNAEAEIVKLKRKGYKDAFIAEVEI